MTGDIDPVDDGSVSPTDASSQGSSPAYNETFFPLPAPTSTPRHGYSSRYGRQTSVSELASHFNRHTLQSSRRSSAIAPTSIPLVLKSHDPTHLAILSTSHSHRIARRRTSAMQRYTPSQLERVSSMVERYLDDTVAPVNLPRRSSVAQEAEFEDPDDDYHPSMMIEEDEVYSPTSPRSFTFGHASPEGDISSNVFPPTPPILPGESTSRRGSLVNVNRLRRRTLTRGRLSISK